MRVPLIVVALLGGCTVWFWFLWFALVRNEHRKTELQLRQERIDEEARRALKRSASDQLRDRLSEFGWEGSFVPIVMAMAFIYAAIVAVLTLVGIDELISIMFAVPFSGLAAAAVLGNLKSRRQQMFSAQLVQALDQFAAALKGGTGPNRAIEQVLPSLPEPLRTEMARAIAQHRANRSLPDAIEEIGRRYPSSAMRKFVAVLRIDETKGGEMAPALEEAANSVRREFELAAEATAEISQERAQFFGIVAVISGIAVYMFTQSSESTQAALRSPAGFMVIALCVGNFLFGIMRVLRMINKAKGAQ